MYDMVYGRRDLVVRACDAVRYHINKEMRYTCNSTYEERNCIKCNIIFHLAGLYKVRSRYVRDGRIRNSPIYNSFPRQKLYSAASFIAKVPKDMYVDVIS